MSELQFSILWNLLALGGKECKLVDSKILVNGFPDNRNEKAKAELKDLVERDYVVRGIPTNDEMRKNPTIDLVGINPSRYEDVKRMVNPDADPFIKEIKPIEDQIPEGFEEKPFLITKGSHRVKGVIANYYFYRKLSDKNFNIVFVFSDRKKRNAIHIGSMYDKNSLYRKTLEGIDRVFQGRGFTKAQMRELGSEIVGNRQPPKALIDLMKNEDYIIQTDEIHFERTPKKIPSSNSIDNFVGKKLKDEIKLKLDKYKSKRLISDE